MTHPGDRHYTVELHASAERVPQIRRILAAHLRYWDLELHIPPVCRGVAELLTNVHRHIGPDARCVVELRWTGRHLTASVADEGPRLPKLLSAAGGGLSTVAALSDSWGTCGTPEGKVIWFTRRVEAARKSRLTARTPLRSVPDTKGQPTVPPPVPAEPLVEPVPEAAAGAAPEAASVSVA
ncbi:ATP-binding protein [Streptomyces sioyaensis]|uniref:ATP-binding protein n=1 Tax=Streptomyces sioyaensis TaxID=67364 RepID=A0A4Q1QJ68_9ACTN|nr:ATP-binding protein [Streptomyces sioyaensis]MBM4792787.1 ATP-binding protein [Streptomyces sioyaensis]RXS59819.1 ATP-binding protein [Streptomyces sioyaensis]